ncbi:MAG TPA: protease pro-enzyme activation domain-containing protein [Streptosporangiaceae bacterium]
MPEFGKWVSRWRPGGRLLAGVTLSGVVVTAAMAMPSAATQAATAGASAMPGRAVPSYVPLWATAKADGGTAAADLGPAKVGAPVAARVYLAGSDSRGLRAYATAVSDPRSGLYRHYLTPAQVQRWFGPDRQQVAAVRSWLTLAGLRVTAVTPRYLAVTGTAAQAGRAFGVVWHSYRVTSGLPNQGTRVATTLQQAPAPTARVTAPGLTGAAVLTVAPTETGIPGYADTAQGPLRTAPTTGATVAGNPAASQPPCSGYYGQRMATTQPKAYGKTAPYAVCGYTPQQLRSAYGVPSGLTGKGENVAIVGVARTPTTPQDVATYARRHGQPLRPGQFTEDFPPGLDATCKTEPSRFAEDFADVELVHAMAPGAGLRYLAAKCDDDGEALPILDGYTAVTDRDSASIVSSAWNARYNEATLSPGLVAAYEQIFQQGAAEGIGFYVDSDDEGNNSSVSPTHRPTVSFPDVDPWVTGVGGTSLAIGPHGRYEWEAGWGDHLARLSSGRKTWSNPPGRFVGGGGGGTSTVFGQPSYQRGVVPSALSHTRGSIAAMRVVPDIATDASLGTGMVAGVTVSLKHGQPASYHEFSFAGTSSSVQLIAGIQADAQQAAGGRAIGFANPAIYARYGTPAYHDVTGSPLGRGTRLDAVGPGRTTVPSTAPFLITMGMDQNLAATPGYDDVSGVGTPASGYFTSWRSHWPAR